MELCLLCKRQRHKYMTPAHSLKTTRSSHSAQYRRHTVMSGIIPFFPKLFHIGIVCLLLWPMSSPHRSLGHSLFKQKFSQKFLGFFLLFFNLSKFQNLALPGVVLKFERSQYVRKKENLFRMFNCFTTLKTTQFALLGACAVIRTNTYIVFIFSLYLTDTPV